MLKVDLFNGLRRRSALGKDFKLDPELNFLPKPYLPHALARLLRRCLDSKRTLNGDTAQAAQAVALKN